MTAWLTTHDLAAVFQLRDPRSAAALARRLGGVKIGGRWRVPPDALDALRVDPHPAPRAATADHLPALALSSRSPSDRDPSPVPVQLAPGWWKEPNEHE